MNEAQPLVSGDHARRHTAAIGAEEARLNLPDLLTCCAYGSGVRGWTLTARGTGDQRSGERGRRALMVGHRESAALAERFIRLPLRPHRRQSPVEPAADCAAHHQLLVAAGEPR